MPSRTFCQIDSEILLSEARSISVHLYSALVSLVMCSAWKTPEGRNRHLKKRAAKVDDGRILFG